MVELKTLLAEPRIVAIVGLSADRMRTSNSIGRYLIEQGFTVVPINPHHDEILGLKSYPDLQSVPTNIEIDIVNIFRQPRHTADVVRDAIKRFEDTGQKPVIWTQIGVSSQEASTLAGEHQLDYVANRCILVEHGRTQMN